MMKDLLKMEYYGSNRRICIYVIVKDKEEKSRRECLEGESNK